METVVIIEGLSCANCTSKIESELANLSGIENVSVDFMTKRLTFNTTSEVAPPALLENIETIIHKIEPGAQLLFNPQSSSKPSIPTSSSRANKQMYRLSIGGVIFVAALILRGPEWARLTLFIFSYLIVGGTVVVSALKSISRGQVFNEQFLMTVATLGAFWIGQYPEAVGVMLFYLVGEIFQDKAVDHSRRSISELMDIRPDFARVKVGEELSLVLPEDVQVGDVFIVQPGEKIPLDGRVLDGISMVDSSALTGESVPKEINPGDEVLSGYINKHGVLFIEATKTYSDSTVAKILYLVENASSRKAPTEKLITKFARYYTPLVVFSALALATIPPLFITGASFSDWTYRALVFLVVSCPCALMISIPLGFFGGVGGASKRGILIKGSNYLDALNDAELVVFDKTGTLTQGVFKVTEIIPTEKIDSRTLLEYAAYAESYSNHPVALSLVDAYGISINKSRIENYLEHPGRGTKAIIDGTEVLVGNALFMNEESVEIDMLVNAATNIYIAIDGAYAGAIVISDEVKPDSAEAIRDLKSLGIKKIIMLTGDRAIVANRLASSLGIDEVYSELLPADKVTQVEEFEKSKSPKGKLIFVGDGINDAPVLARADIGIAMGGLGSDAAIEAADIIIMNDEPSQITTAIRIAHRTRRIVFQNIFMALGVKSIFLVAGALGSATMWEAVFADVGVALLAIFNAMRVLNTRDI